MAYRESPPRSEGYEVARCSWCEWHRPHERIGGACGNDWRVRQLQRQHAAVFEEELSLEEVRGVAVLVHSGRCAGYEPDLGTILLRVLGLRRAQWRVAESEAGE